MQRLNTTLSGLYCKEFPHFSASVLKRILNTRVNVRLGGFKGRTQGGYRKFRKTSRRVLAQRFIFTKKYGDTTKEEAIASSFVKALR
jgi:hypothetical protein